MDFIPTDVSFANDVGKSVISVFLSVKYTLRTKNIGNRGLILYVCMDLCLCQVSLLTHSNTTSQSVFLLFRLILCCVLVSFPVSETEIVYLNY